MENPEENLHILHKQRKPLKTTLDIQHSLRDALKELGIQTEDENIAKLREALDGINKKVGEKLKTKKDEKGRDVLDIGASKKLLREHKRITEQFIDYNAIKAEIEKFSNFDDLYKLKIQTKKEILKRLLHLKKTRSLQFGDIVLDSLNDTLREIDSTINKLASLNPIDNRAYHLVSYAKQINTPGSIIETETITSIKEAIQNALIVGSPTLLHGPTGTGKTTIAIKVAYDLNGKMPDVVYCNPETRQSDVWGRQGLRATDKGTETVDIYGPLSKAMREGNVCIFDEFTALPANQSVFIKGILNKRPGDRVSVPGNGEIIVNQGFQLLFTANLKSEKNRERQEMPPEVANEFGQNNIYVGYQSKEESYDIMISRLLNKDGCIDLSMYDLEQTLPKFAIAMKEIQDAYTTPISQETSTLLSLPYQLNLPPQLKKMVLNQRTVFHILETYKVERLRNNDISFREYLDQRLKKELTFGEYPLQDRILVAKILASHGLLTTLTEKELNLPEKTLDFNLAKVFKEKTEEQIEESKKVEHISLKDICQIDPFNSNGANIQREAGDLDKGIETSKQKEGQVEVAGNKDVEDFLLDTYKGWGVEQAKLNSIVFKGEYKKPSQIDYNQIKDDIDKAKFGEYILNPDCKNIDWSKVDKNKIKVVDLSGFVGKKVTEVMEHLKTAYPESNYIYPDLTYFKYLYENQTDIPSKLKDGKNHFFPGSLFRRSAGRLDVPCGDWDSAWYRVGLWLSRGWVGGCRVVLLER